MKREEFLNTLFENIPDYTKEEQEEIRQYYEELICDGVEAGLDEEEVISRLESPENIAFSLKKEYKEERKQRSALSAIHRMTIHPVSLLPML